MIFKMKRVRETSNINHTENINKYNINKENKDNINYKCFICDNKISLLDMDEHIKIHINENKYNTIDNINNKNNIKLNKIYKCSTCNKYLESRSAYKMHICSRT